MLWGMGSFRVVQAAGQVGRSVATLYKSEAIYSQENLLSSYIWDAYK